MIELVNVTKRFGKQVVLDGISMEFPVGKISAIIGRSGIGKSVLLKHLIGILRPDSGSVLVDGLDITKMGEIQLNEVRKKFGMLFQGAALFDSMTVFENVAFPLREKTRMKEKEIRDRVEEKLEALDLSGMGDKYPDEVSGGMKKRVGLARALIQNPDIILFDEPTTGMDPMMETAIHLMIMEAQKRFGFTAVIVSHEIPEIFHVAHRVAMLHNGTIVEDLPAEEFQNSSNPITQQFISGRIDGPIKVA
ncbi:MAG: ABC transporter ATP-binding protein [Nitrospinae bacterium]|nr:ABC transporter ATP-binding protein [Nitrospinota bacterium]